MLLAVGLNHQTAPVELREKVAIAPDRTLDALRQLRGTNGVGEAAILSTCNRTELYCRVDPAATGQPVAWLHQFANLDHGFLEAFLYRHADADAVRHLLRVAAGLDSMVLGEPEILGQVKNAYRLAREAAALDQVLDRLFQHSLHCAKQVRTDTEIGRGAVSVAYAAVTIARRLFGDFSNKTVLAIGAGETIELTLRHASRDRPIGQLIIANRSIARARELANRMTGTAIGLEQLDDWLPRADLIFSSTAATEPIVTRKAMERAVASRKRKPVLAVDLAVPRDIEASVAKMEDIYLYTVDDLDGIVDEGLSARQEAMKGALELVEVQVDQYMAWLRVRAAADVIRSYRSTQERIRDEMLEQAQAEIARGSDPAEVMAGMARRLTAKLINSPTQSLRAAAEAGDYALLETARDLLGIKE